MKQVLQNRKTGKVAVVDVPVPALQRGRVLVRTVASLISSGTERAAVEQARKSLLQEARERPDLVRSVLEKARTDGLKHTFGAVRDKLAASQALGYSRSEEHTSERQSPCNVVCRPPPEKKKNIAWR